MKEIYLDHAATTRVDDRVVAKMLPYFTEVYGNPNSQHGYGRNAQEAVDEARDTIAKLIGAKPGEIYFTSGGTESDNWALRGTCKALAGKGKHVIISKIEHAAMLTTAHELEKALVVAKEQAAFCGAVHSRKPCGDTVAARAQRRRCRKQLQPSGKVAGGVLRLSGEYDLSEPSVIQHFGVHVLISRELSRFSVH